MCDKCIHKPVCSIYRATGGKKSCEYYREEWKQADEIDFDYEAED